MPIRIKPPIIPPTKPIVRNPKIKPLYDQSDVTHAIANLVYITFKTLGEAVLPAPVANAIHISFFLSGLHPEIQAYKAIPDSMESIKTLANPLWRILAGYFPFVGKVNGAATFMGVAGVSLKKLFVCVENGADRPLEALKGSALHLFNLFAQANSTAHQLAEYNTPAPVEAATP